MAFQKYAPQSLDRSISNWYVPQNCFKNLKEEHIKSKISAGSFGTIYDLCDDNNICQKIAKVVPLVVLPSKEMGAIDSYINGFETAERYSQLINQKTDEEEYNPETVFNDEVETTRLASDLGVAPKLFNSFICPDVLRFPEGGKLIPLGFIIQEKWDITLGDYYKNYGEKLPQNLITEIKRKVKLLHQHGIVHADIDPRNIVLRIQHLPDGNVKPIDIALIDFGISERFDKVQDSISNFEMRRLERIL